MSKGQYTQTTSLYGRAEAVREEVLGHLDVTQSFLQRGGCYFYHLFLGAVCCASLVIPGPFLPLAKYAETKLYERCQTIQEKALGPEHPSLAAMRSKWAGLLPIVCSRRSILALTALLSRFPCIVYQDKYDEAESLYVRAIAIGEKVRGPDHPDLAMFLNNRAALLKDQVRVEHCCVECGRDARFSV